MTNIQQTISVNSLLIIDSYPLIRHLNSLTALIYDSTVHLLHSPPYVDIFDAAYTQHGFVFHKVLLH